MPGRRTVTEPSKYTEIRQGEVGKVRLLAIQVKKRRIGPRSAIRFILLKPSSNVGRVGNQMQISPELAVIQTGTDLQGDRKARDLTRATAESRVNSVREPRRECTLIVWVPSGERTTEVDAPPSVPFKPSRSAAAAPNELLPGQW